ncbi:MAG: DUF2505 family protein [Polyangiales bacterium]
MSYTVRHIIETDVDTLWRLLFDLEVARALLAKHGNPGGFNILEERTDDRGLVHRRVDWWSNVELPGFAKKLVGDGAYTEVGCLDRKASKYTAQCIPKLGAEKFNTSFEITLSPVEGGRHSERQITTENTIKVFGLGAMIAKGLEHVQRDSHAQSADFLNEWVRAKKHLVTSADATSSGA